MTTHRAWCFTLNNYEAEYIPYLQEESIRSQCTYIIFGEEVGEQGTRHLQGYIHFKRAVGLKKCRTIMPTAHWEAAKGSAEDNKKYCSKEGKAIEWGELPKQGKRSDIEMIREMIGNGASMADICQEATSYQSLRCGELMLKYKAMPKRVPPKVMWYWGKTGTGKTRTAFEEAGDDVWISGQSLRWWDGYVGQKTVILDDLRDTSCHFDTLLRILDRYPFRVETKGSSVWLEAETIIVTSPYPPEKIYESRCHEDIEQLKRRISVVKKFEGPEVGGNTEPRPSGESK